MTAKTIAFDFETFLITRERPAPVAVCMSWYDGTRGAVIPHGDHVAEWLHRKLSDPDVRLVGHNVAYDMAVATANHPELGPLVFQAYHDGRVTDTGIRQQLWDIATGRASFDDTVRRYSLAALVQMIFDRDISASKSGPDVWRLKYGELHGVPFDQWPDAAVDYPLSDAQNTWDVWNAQREKVGDLIKCDAEMSYGAFALALMAANGMRTDLAAVADLKARNLATLEKLRPALVEAGLIALGGTKKAPKWVKKDKAARARMAELCAAKGLKPMLTKAKAVSIEKAACHYVDDPLMLQRAAYTLAEKILATYVPPLEQGGTLPITTNFNMAATTRTTSSAPRPPAVGTNMQVAPRDGGIRECYKPRDGYLYLAGDFSGAELHAFAEVATRKVGFSVMGDVLKAGRDVHLFVGSALLGLEYDEAKVRKDQGDPDVKQARQEGKTAVFGFLGAMGIPTFLKTQLKYGTRYTVEKGKALKAGVMGAFPELPKYFDHCKRELGPSESATIELWPGGPLRKVKGLSTICNSYFQAPVARGAKAAAAAVTRECYVTGGLLDGTRPGNFIHDEVLTETPRAGVDVLDARARFFAKTMEDAFNVVVPNYPTTVDTVLMERWSKGAEPTYDEKGRLVVCKS